jgi:zinc transporter 1/2/3
LLTRIVGKQLELPNDLVSASDSSFHPHQHNHNLQSYSLAAVIFIHALIEGVTIGMQVILEDVIIIAVAIGAHKFFEAVLLAVSFVKHGMALRKFLRILLPYSLMSSIGIAFGILITKTVADLAIVWVIQGVFGSLSAGIFIYIATINILNEEFASEKIKHPWHKLGLVFLGFSVMAVVAIWG